MKIRYGNDVEKANGEKVGEVKYVVIDPKNDEVSHIIVEEGFILKEDRVLPISLVADANEERVELYELQEPLEEMPKYREENYVEVDTDRSMSTQVAGPAILYDYPPIGMQSDRTQDETKIRQPVHSEIHGDKKTIRAGARVISLDGEYVGDVSEIVIDPNTDELSHFVISEGVLLVEKKMIPADWIEEISESSVKLVVDEQVVSNLPEYQKEEEVGL